MGPGPPTVWGVREWTRSCICTSTANVSSKVGVTETLISPVVDALLKLAFDYCVLICLPQNQFELDRTLMTKCTIVTITGDYHMRRSWDIIWDIYGYMWEWREAHPYNLLWKSWRLHLSASLLSELSEELDYHVDSIPSQPAQCECHLFPSWRTPIMSKSGIGDLDV